MSGTELKETATEQKKNHNAQAKAVERKINNCGIKTQKYNLGGRMKMKYPRERSARVGLTVPKGKTRKLDNNGVW